MLWLLLFALLVLLVAAGIAAGRRRAAAFGGKLEAATPGGGAAVVVLIHGTFASKASWIRRGSEMAQAMLTVAASTRLYSFTWSGGNSHAARRQAGSELACFILMLRQAGYRDVRLVAHSHGGNVVLYALQDARARALVSRIAFLGTPFLSIRRRNVRRFAGDLAAGLQFAPVFLLGGLAMAVDLGSLGPVGLVLFVLVGAFAAYAGGRWMSKAGAVAIAAWLRRRRIAFARIVRFLPSRIPCFVAHVKGDEPARYLVSLEMMTSLPLRLLPGIRAAAAGMGTTLIAAKVAGPLVGFDALRAIDPLIIVSGALLFLAPVWLPSLSAAVSRASRGTWIGFGGEPLLAAATLEITPHVLPRWSCGPGSRVYEWSPPERFRGLLHSALYSDPAVIGELSRWLKNEAGEGEESAPVVRETGRAAAAGLSIAGWFAGAVLLSMLALHYVDRREEERARQALRAFDRCVRESLPRMPGPDPLRVHAARAHCRLTLPPVGPGKQ